MLRGRLLFRMGKGEGREKEIEEGGRKRQEGWGERGEREGRERRERERRESGREGERGKEVEGDANLCALFHPSAVRSAFTFECADGEGRHHVSRACFSYSYPSESGNEDAGWGTTHGNFDNLTLFDNM